MQNIIDEIIKSKLDLIEKSLEESKEEQKK